MIVWQKSHRLVPEVYQLTKVFPKEEIYGLTSQLRRSATSVPANVAEGFKKRELKDKAKFMNTAQGSLDESHCYLILAHNLGYADTTQSVSQLEEVGKILESYCQSLLNSLP